VGENMVKGAKGTKISHFPKTTHDMCHFCVGL
jgi:hypothetical protein